MYRIVRRRELAGGEIILNEIELLMAQLSAFQEEEREALQAHGLKEPHRCPIEEVLMEKEVE